MNSLNIYQNSVAIQKYSVNSIYIYITRRRRNAPYHVVLPVSGVFVQLVHIAGYLDVGVVFDRLYAEHLQQRVAHVFRRTATVRHGEQRRNNDDRVNTTHGRDYTLYRSIGRNARGRILNTAMCSRRLCDTCKGSETTGATLVLVVLR